MTFKIFKIICFVFLTFLVIFYSTKINALSHKWIEVPQSQYGEQLWDQNSAKKNKNGYIRVLSKFIPKTTTGITKDILYTMDVDCSNKSFRDVSVGVTKFDDYENDNAAWKDPNGDKLIMGVIDQVCAFIN